MGGQNGVGKNGESTRAEHSVNGHRISGAVAVQDLQREPPLAALLRRATQTHVLVVIVAGLVGVGFAAAMYLGGLANKNDVAGVEKEVRELATRVNRTEVILDRIDGAVHEIAQRIGIPGVPPTSTAPGSTNGTKGQP